MERPPDSSWELADSLMQTLSAPLPPDSPVAASYKDMMHQLKADVTSALLACTHQDEQHPGQAYSSTAGAVFLRIFVYIHSMFSWTDDARAAKFFSVSRVKRPNEVPNTRCLASNTRWYQMR